MANHLHELIGVWNSDKEQWGEYLTLTENAVCFHMGSPEEWDDIPIIHDIAKPPYPAVWVELKYPGFAPYGVLMREKNGGYEGHFFAVPGKLQCKHMFTFVCVLHSDETCEFSLRGPDDVIKDEKSCMALVLSVFAFFSAMACTNVRRVEHKPDAKLQKARAKRGKQPLFSYWTLELDLTRPESSESLGGTHASPRVHLRRGHARQYAKGKYTWVQPCMVGNKAAGMIHKDYSVAV